MTFKHVKFEDSAVMRSLQKVATEKGWAKPEPLTKSASSKLDLFPTTNLTENILKLCEGLRHQGFNKYADELEDKFVVYKQAAAATLYETSSEEGEDLVDRAHPKGSHHLENVDSDEAVIETILDQHLKDTKMVEKKPTGKLSNSGEILDAVKTVLGQVPAQDFGLGLKDQPAGSKNAPMKLNMSDVDAQLIMSDQAWSDGDRANAKYINEVLARAVAPLGKAVELLGQLEGLASDNRFPKGTATAVGNGKKYLTNFVSDYLKACNTAFTNARAMEKQRLNNVNDLEQSRVTFEEVGAPFKSGVLSRTPIGKQTSFTGVLSSMESIEHGLGNLIFDKFSPGFDFDEPYMKGIRDKSMGIFDQIKSVLGSK